MNNLLNSSWMLLIMAIFSLAVACNTNPEPKEKVIPEEALVEEENATETEAEEKVVEEAEMDQTAIMTAELEALEAALEAEAPKRSRSEAENNTETPVEKCMRRCEKILDNMEHTTQSGSTVNKHNDCVANCQKLATLCEDFQKCIKNATTEEEKKACRQNYMENRPWDHTK
jgi:hypothetical protein